MSGRKLRCSRSLILAIAALTVFSGCSGGGHRDDPAPPPPPPPPATSPAPPPAAEPPAPPPPPAPDTAAEAAAARKKAEEEAARKKAEEDARQAAEAEAARKKAEEEAVARQKERDAWNASQAAKASQLIIEKIYLSRYDTPGRRTVDVSYDFTVSIGGKSAPVKDAANVFTGTAATKTYGVSYPIDFVTKKPYFVERETRKLEKWETDSQDNVTSDEKKTRVVFDVTGLCKVDVPVVLKCVAHVQAPGEPPVDVTFDVSKPPACDINHLRDATFEVNTNDSTLVVNLFVVH